MMNICVRNKFGVHLFQIGCFTVGRWFWKPSRSTHANISAWSSSFLQLSSIKLTENLRNASWSCYRIELNTCFSKKGFEAEYQQLQSAMQMHTIKTFKKITTHNYHQIIFCIWTATTCTELNCLICLPAGDVKWLTEEEISILNVSNLPDDNDKGYIIECDLEYSTDLHASHSNYPLAPENMIVSDRMLSAHSNKMWRESQNHYISEIKRTKTSKRIPNLYNKKKLCCTL